MAADEVNSGNDRGVDEIAKTFTRPLVQELARHFHIPTTLNSARRTMVDLMSAIWALRKHVPPTGIHPASIAPSSSSSSSRSMPYQFYVGEAPCVDGGLDLSAAAANAALPPQPTSTSSSAPAVLPAPDAGPKPNKRQRSSKMAQSRKELIQRCKDLMVAAKVLKQNGHLEQLISVSNAGVADMSAWIDKVEALQLTYAQLLKMFFFHFYILPGGLRPSALSYLQF